MIAIPKIRMTADEFLAWAEAQPKEAGKFELFDGEIIQIHGPAGQQSERAEHWHAKALLYRALHDAIKRARLPCFAVPDGASVRLDASRVVEPDALVYCGDRLKGTLEVPNPLIVVEVLSPGNARHDTATKLDAYLRHETIRHYLVVDPDQPLVIHHEKTDDQRWLTRIITGGSIRLDPPGLDVDLSEMFEPG
jgi:Uma2 family endonuclease